MGDKTKISWADATWNPITGCTPVSIGCEHCYAKRLAGRFPQIHGYLSDTKFSEITYHLDRLDIPFHWRKPKRIFICSMGDLFHEQVKYAWIVEVFSVIRDNPQHTFIILTKRPERMLDYFRSWDGREKDNVWLGVTAENQEMADKRIPILLQIPAAKRFVSVEPMLGPVNFTEYLYKYELRRGIACATYSRNPDRQIIPAIDCVICGPETGPGARPMNLDWARSLRDQCIATDTPYFYKNGLLDGKPWQQFPEV